MRVIATAQETAPFWRRVLPDPPVASWRTDAHRIWAEAQARRVRAEYNTGSITEAAVYCLRAICETFRPRVVIEIGTFIGTSALAMAGATSVEALYTCDFSNDCLPAEGVVHTFPHLASTKMFTQLVARNVQADLCFFDGVINAEDAPLLRTLTYASTVYLFDDYCYGPKLRKGAWATVPRKGIGNVDLLTRQLPSHVLIAPREPAPMLAALVPKVWL